MATVRVRYRTGDTDEWHLHERQNVDHVMSNLASGLAGSKIVGFGTETREGNETTDYGMVCLRMGEVVAWEVDGALDIEQLGGIWPQDGSEAPAD